MSKRVTLTNEDIEILKALIEKALHMIKPYNTTEMFANQRKQQILNKLQDKTNE